MEHEPPPGLSYQSVSPTDELPIGFAVASLICGIVSIPLFCIWFVSIPLAVAAVLSGRVAHRRHRRGVADWGGIAIAGLTCGLVTLGGFAAIVLVAVIRSVTGH